jgi:hypothetical protein
MTHVALPVKIRTFGISCALVAFCVGAVGTDLIHNILHGSRCEPVAPEVGLVDRSVVSTALQTSGSKGALHGCLLYALLSHVQLFKGHRGHVAVAQNQPLGCFAHVSIGIPNGIAPQSISPRAPPSFICS